MEFLFNDIFTSVENTCFRNTSEFLFINVYELFNVKTILREKQQWYYLTQS